jgi:hypothetical protein
MKARSYPADSVYWRLARHSLEWTVWRQYNTLVERVFEGEGANLPFALFWLAELDSHDIPLTGVGAT